MIHCSGLLALFGTTALCIQTAKEFIDDKVQTYKDLTAFKVAKTLLKLPYELALTYVSIIESYADEYKMEHANQEAQWYHYPYFCIASVWYISMRMTGYMNECIKQRYRDTTLRDIVTQVDDQTIEVLYEWKKQSYVVRVDIEKMLMKELTSAEAILEDGTVVDVTKRIKELLGPLEDWHHLVYTPQMFGWKKLTLNKFDSDELEYVSIEYVGDDKMPRLH